MIEEAKEELEEIYETGEIQKHLIISLYRTARDYFDLFFIMLDAFLSTQEKRFPKISVDIINYTTFTYYRWCKELEKTWKSVNPHISRAELDLESKNMILEIEKYFTRFKEVEEGWIKSYIEKISEKLSEEEKKEIESFLEIVYKTYKLDVLFKIFMKTLYK